jgi:hypothetical protein
MLPQVQVNQPRPRRPRPRPISPADNPSTTGLLVNPNGSYVANPTGAGGFAGAQGGFGATLPQVNVGQTFAQQAASFAGPNIYQQNAGQTWMNFRPQTPTASPRPSLQTTFAPVSPSASNFQQYQTYGPPRTNMNPAQPNMQAFRQGEQGNLFDANNPILGAVVQRLANGEAADLTTQDQEALERFLLKEAGIEAPAGSSAGGNSEFMNTRFMQENQERGTGFYDQLRWDPQRKKYVKIGDLIRQGRLDVRTGKDIYKKRRGGGGRQQNVSGMARQRQVQPQEQPRFGYGIIQGSLNTATG